MTTSSASSRTRRPGAAISPETVLGLLALLAPILAAVAARGMAPLGVSAAVLALLVVLRRDGRLPWPPRSFGLIFGAVLVWSWATVIWAHRPEPALEQALELLYLIPPVVLLGSIAAGLGEADRQRIAVLLATGFVVSVILLAGSVLVGTPLRGLWDADGSDLVAINDSMTTTAVLLWPAMLALNRIVRRYRTAALAAIAVVVALIVGQGASLSATVAVTAGMAVFVLALLNARAMRLALAASVLAMGLVAVPGAKLMDAQGLAEATWLPQAAAHRVDIWDLAAERILDRPLLGWGLGNSRVLPPSPEISTVTGQPRSIPLHPHNAVLQVWLELGILGPGLLLILSLAILHAIGRWRPFDQAMALGAFTAVWVIANLSYGLWQGRWIMSMAICAVLVTAMRRESPTGGRA